MHPGYQINRSDCSTYASSKTLDSGTTPSRIILAYVPIGENVEKCSWKSVFRDVPTRFVDIMVSLTSGRPPGAID